jgi:hypothetical protein
MPGVNGDKPPDEVIVFDASPATEDRKTANRIFVRIFACSKSTTVKGLWTKLRDVSKSNRSVKRGE